MSTGWDCLAHYKKYPSYRDSKISQTIIKVENISKKYIPGQEQNPNNYKTFPGAITDTAKALAIAIQIKTCENT